LAFRLGYLGYKLPTKYRVEKREHEIIVTGLLIDSLYKNTNYFTEVIAECSNYRNAKNKLIINHTDVVTEYNDEQRDIYKILSLILLIIIITLFIYIKIKNNGKARLVTNK